MRLAEHSRSVVERTIARLRDEFGQFDVLGETVELSRAGFGRKREAVGRGRIGSACVLVQNDADEVLMTRLSTVPAVWSIPEGRLDEGDRPTDAAARAVDETTGVACSIDDVFQVRRIRTTLIDRPSAPTLHGVRIYFEGHYEGGIPQAWGDVQAVRWRSSPPSAVEATIRPRIDEWAQDVRPSAAEGTSAGT
jgi:ADP-ribose pyrophosphatase YjhB (NUDIX family)